MFEITISIVSTMLTIIVGLASVLIKTAWDRIIHLETLLDAKQKINMDLQDKLHDKGNYK